MAVKPLRNVGWVGLGLGITRRLTLPESVVRELIGRDTCPAAG
jgi:hypothetical protein